MNSKIYRKMFGITVKKVSELNELTVEEGI